MFTTKSLAQLSVCKIAKIVKGRTRSIFIAFQFFIAYMNDNRLLPYFRPLIILTLLVGIVMVALHFGGILGAHENFSWLCYIFFSLLTLPVMGISGLSKGMSSPQKSVGLILGAMAMRFIFSLLFLLAYILFARPKSAAFIAPFFILYTLYTIVETRVLIRLSQ